jgi:hypothetical protein
MNVPVTRTRVVALAAALFALLALGACSQAAKPVPPPPPPVTLGFCGSNPQVMPDVVLVVCSTDDITARNLAWSGWGKPTATAKGSATVNLCAYTDCAGGDYISVPIDVTASKIVACSKKTRAYSVLRYKFPDGSPFKGLSASDTGPGYFGGQNQPVPPVNQTVSLTC